MRTNDCRLNYYKNGRNEKNSGKEVFGLHSRGQISDRIQLCPFPLQVIAKFVLQDHAFYF
jgi:hypothetical protein